MRHCAWGFALAALLIAGCTSPRVVSSTPTGGCIAIPNNSDSWPSYNMTKAKEKMSELCPAGYKVIREEEVVVGQTTTNNTQRDTKEVPIAKGLAVDVQQTTRNTTETRDRTEYRIWFQKN